MGPAVPAQPPAGSGVRWRFVRGHAVCSPARPVSRIRASAHDLTPSFAIRVFFPPGSASLLPSPSSRQSLCQSPEASTASSLPWAARGHLRLRSHRCHPPAEQGVGTGREIRGKKGVVSHPHAHTGAVSFLTIGAAGGGRRQAPSSRGPRPPPGHLPAFLQQQGHIPLTLLAGSTRCWPQSPAATSRWAPGSSHASSGSISGSPSTSRAGGMGCRAEGKGWALMPGSLG